jgi:HPt (histidine-containing phosphotransfer) domain-containing protein
MHSDKPGKALDLNVALIHVDGDLRLLSELATIFLQDYPNLMEEARLAILQSDYSGLERAAHTLKGRLAFFGIAALRDQVLDLEMMGRDQVLVEAPQALTKIEMGMQSILPEFDALVRESAS